MTCSKIGKEVKLAIAENNTRLAKPQKVFIKKRDVFKYIWSEVPINNLSFAPLFRVIYRYRKYLESQLYQVS